MDTSNDFGRLAVLKENGSEQREYFFKAESCSIGTFWNATIRFQTRVKCSPAIYCVIDVDSNGIAILTNKSSNPVKVNGVDVDQQKCLRNGDVINILDIRFCYKNENLSENLLDKAETLPRALKTSRAGRFSVYPTTAQPVKVIPVHAKKKRSNSLADLKQAQQEARELKTPSTRKSERIKRSNSFSAISNLSAMLPSKRPATPHMTKGFRVATPKSEIKPTLRNKIIIKNATRSTPRGKPKPLRSKLETPPFEEYTETHQDMKTPVMETVEEDFSTPQNNTSVVLVESPAKETTPLRSRKSLAKNLSMQRLLQSDDSIVVDTPISKTSASSFIPETPTLTIPVLDVTKTSKGALKRSNLMCEMFEEVFTSTPAKRKSDLIVEDVSEVEESVASDFTEESIHGSSFADKSTGKKTSRRNLEPTKSYLEDTELDSENINVDMIKLRRISARSSRTSFVKSKVLTPAPSKLESGLFDGEGVLEKTANLKIASKRTSIKTPKAAEKSITPIDLQFTNSNTTDDLLIKEKESNFTTGLEQSPHSPLKSPEVDANFQGSIGILRPSSNIKSVNSTLTESSVSSKSSQDRVLRQRRKRMRETDGSSICAKRFHYAQDDSSLVQDASKNASSILMISPVGNIAKRKALTEPRNNKKWHGRKSLQVAYKFTDQENIPDDTCYMQNSSVESIDTSSIIYMSGEHASDDHQSLDNMPSIKSHPESDLSQHQDVKSRKSVRIQKQPENDLTSPRGIKRLMRTPRVQKEPKNDLSNPLGVKRLMRTPKLQKQPKNNLSSPRGVKQLMKTPRIQKEPENNLNSPYGVKQLMKTPRIQKEPENNLSSPYGVKQLMKTPKIQKEPENNLSSPYGVKQLLKTPKVYKEANNDLTNIDGIKQLFATPKPNSEPLNDLSNPIGVKQLPKIPKVVKGPKNDLTSPYGVRSLFARQNEPTNNLMNVSGVKELFEEGESLFPTTTIRTYTRTSKICDALNVSSISNNDPIDSLQKSDVDKWVSEQSVANGEKIVENDYASDNADTGTLIRECELKKVAVSIEKMLPTQGQAIATRARRNERSLAENASTPVQLLINDVSNKGEEVDDSLVEPLKAKPKGVTTRARRNKLVQMEEVVVSPVTVRSRRNKNIDNLTKAQQDVEDVEPAEEEEVLKKVTRSRAKAAKTRTNVRRGKDESVKDVDKTKEEITSNIDDLVTVEVKTRKNTRRGQKATSVEVLDGSLVEVVAPLETAVETTVETKRTRRRGKTVSKPEVVENLNEEAELVKKVAIEDSEPAQEVDKKATKRKLPARKNTRRGVKVNEEAATTIKETEHEDNENAMEETENNAIQVPKRANTRRGKAVENEISSDEVLPDVTKRVNPRRGKASNSENVETPEPKKRVLTRRGKQHDKQESPDDEVKNVVVEKKEKSQKLVTFANDLSPIAVTNKRTRRRLQSVEDIEIAALEAEKKPARGKKLKESSKEDIPQPIRKSARKKK